MMGFSAGQGEDDEVSGTRLCGEATGLREMVSCCIVRMWSTG
jgi:hypothetical protein